MRHIQHAVGNSHLFKDLTYPRQGQNITSETISMTMILKPATLKPREGQSQTEYPDPGQRGLILIVSASSKTWTLRSTLHGKKIKFSLGRWPEIDQATARKKCSQLMGQIDQGQDPRGVTATVAEA